MTCGLRYAVVTSGEREGGACGAGEYEAQTKLQDVLYHTGNRATIL